jgi:dienelactone hydrolase
MAMPKTALHGLGGLMMLFTFGVGCATAQRTPTSTAVTATSDASEFELRGEGGLVMHARLYLPDGDGPFGAALLLPGGRGAAEVGKVWRHHHSFAEQLGQQGFAALVLDYQSAERSLQDPRTIADIGVAIDALKSHARIRRDRVFLIGFSMGGANALRVAGSRSDIAGLVTYFSPVSFNGAAASGMSKQPIDYASRVSCPVLILQGDRDDITPVEQARTLSRVLTDHGKRGPCRVCSPTTASARNSSSTPTPATDSPTSAPRPPSVATTTPRSPPAHSSPSSNSCASSCGRFPIEIYGLPATHEALTRRPRRVRRARAACAAGALPNHRFVQLASWNITRARPFRAPP